MNVIALLVVIGVLFKTLSAQENPRNVSKVENFLYERCKHYSTEASAFDQVKNHVTQFSDYLAYTASLLPDGKKQFCNDEKARLVELMRELAQEMKPCFPKQEKYLPKFLYQSFVGFLNFACEDRNIENFFSTQGSECRIALKSQQAGTEVGHCFKKLFTTFDGVVDQDELCRDLKLARTCFGEAIHRHCPNFAGYESLNYKFFKAIREPCKSLASVFGSNTLILLIAYLSSKIFI